MPLVLLLRSAVNFAAARIPHSHEKNPAGAWALAGLNSVSRTLLTLTLEQPAAVPEGTAACAGETKRLAGISGCMQSRRVT